MNFSFPRLFGALLFFTSSAWAADNAGTVAVLDGGITLNTYQAGDSPAARAHSIHRQKMLIDTSSGNYAIIDLHVTPKSRSCQVVLQGNLTSFTLPVDAAGHATVTYLCTGSVEYSPQGQDDTGTNNHSFVQIMGANNPVLSKAAGLASSFPRAVSYFASYANYHIDGVATTVSVGTSTGNFVLDLPETLANRDGRSYDDALNTLLTALGKAGYAEE